MPPKLTAVAPVKLVPVIVTTVPMSADVGVKEVIVGCGIAKVKPETVAVPPGVVTLTFPLVAPVPTIAIICVELTDVGLAITPPIVTEYAEAVKLVPVIVIGVPCPPVLGLKPLMVGSRAKVKPEAVAVPPGVVILTTPTGAGTHNRRDLRRRTSLETLHVNAAKTNYSRTSKVRPCNSYRLSLPRYDRSKR